MKRRVWALAAASVLSGWANAQTPTTPATNVPAPNASKDAAPEPGVMVLRTAGQPDRKVKVLKSTKQPDGRVITEVKDMTTGETMLVADRAPGGKNDAVAQDVKPTASMVAKPSSLAADLKTPPTTLLPKAKSRDTDPLLNAPKSSSPAAMTASAAPLPADPVVPDSKPMTQTNAKPAAKSMVMPSAIAPKAQTVPVPMPRTQAPALLPMKAVASANSPIHVVLPVGYVPAEFRMKDETAQDVAALQSASRPSVRQDAATALAEGRYGSRMEVKTILANTAMHDPAPVVRAHCITCLGKLGFTTPEYLGYLRQCSADTDSDVKLAAANALMKIEPKR